MNQSSYQNAKQIFEAYGIPRSALNQLALEGRVDVRLIETDVATTKLYSVADIEKVIGGDYEEK